jgi:MFS family permease|tara:strand:+ start:2840 stop:4276 length:1437 start_codon:yes stop_codon:yes gene_type:complete
VQIGASNLLEWLPNLFSMMPMSTVTNISSTEKRAIASLASLYALRMLGLFMVLPVMAIAGAGFEGATPELIGLAIGAYGLSQALLQIPAGALSDYFGRKPIIVIGLLIFALGSFVAANADTIYGIIFGRFLQGCGAIASAVMALVSDLTREEHRMKAMASIGASIGLSFSVALVLGPVLVSFGGLQLIFIVTGILSLAGIALMLTAVPTPARKKHRDGSAIISEVFKQLGNGQLWPLNIGIFILHALMVAMFVSIPQQLVQAGLTLDQHAWLYLPVLLIAFVLMVPFVIIAEKKKQMKGIVITALGIMILALILMSQAAGIWPWAIALGVFFWAFNIMEATLPSWLSKVAPAGAKGSAMGIYSTLQFLGAFAGGIIGGWLNNHFGIEGLFLILASAVFGWALLVIVTPKPAHLNSVRVDILNQGHSDVQHSLYLDALINLRGVADAILIAEEHAIYLKVDASVFDYQQAMAAVNSLGE